MSKSSKEMEMELDTLSVVIAPGQRSEFIRKSMENKEFTLLKNFIINGRLTLDDFLFKPITIDDLKPLLDLLVSEPKGIEKLFAFSLGEIAGQPFSFYAPRGEKDMKRNYESHIKSSPQDELPLAMCEYVGKKENFKERVLAHMISLADKELLTKQQLITILWNALANGHPVVYTGSKIRLGYMLYQKRPHFTGSSMLFEMANFWVFSTEAALHNEDQFYGMPNILRGTLSKFFLLLGRLLYPDSNLFKDNAAGARAREAAPHYVAFAETIMYCMNHKPHTFDKLPVQTPKDLLELYPDPESFFKQQQGVEQVKRSTLL